MKSLLIFILCFLVMKGFASDIEDSLETYIKSQENFKSKCVIIKEKFHKEVNRLISNYELTQNGKIRYEIRESLKRLNSRKIQ